MGFTPPRDDMVFLDMAVFFTVSSLFNPYFFTDLLIDFYFKILYDKIASYGDADMQTPWVFAKRYST